MTSSAQSQQFPVSLVYKWLTPGLIFNCSFNKRGYAKGGKKSLGNAVLLGSTPSLRTESQDLSLAGQKTPLDSCPLSLTRMCFHHLGRKAD